MEKEEVGSATWRNGWFGTIALLRGIGHALAKEDAVRSKYLTAAVEQAWVRWKVDLYSSQIFFGFIDDERNALLKEYKFANQRKIYPATTADSFLGPHDVLIAGRVVSPSRALAIAWDWLRVEIKKIEAHADDMRLTDEGLTTRSTGQT